MTLWQIRVPRVFYACKIKTIPLFTVELVLAEMSSCMLRCHSGIEAGFAAMCGVPALPM